jgi:hypothetical protein
MADSYFFALILLAVNGTDLLASDGGVVARHRVDSLNALDAVLLSRLRAVGQDVVDFELDERSLVREQVVEKQVERDRDWRG